MDEMLTPTDIQKHLKIGRNKTYQLIQLSPRFFIVFKIK